MKKSPRFQSFRYALKGLSFVFHQEKNFRIECFFTGLVLLSFLFLSFSRIEMILLLLLCGLVLILEIVNTVVEHFLDLIKPRMSYQVEVVKDILAGMVLVSVLLSIVIGALIYIPALIEFLLPFVVQ